MNAGYEFTHQEYLSNAQLAEMFRQMVDEGSYDKVFAVDSTANEVSWISHVRDNAWMVSVTKAGEQQAVVWLDGFSGRVAMLHYWVCRSAWGTTDTLAEAVFGWLRSQLAGTVEHLIGNTPADNRLALRLLKRCGFKVQFEIPEAVVNANGVLVDTVISYRRL